MTVSINGTTGISGVDGNASTPALQGSDTNTGISFGTDEVAINTGGTARVTVDGAGRLLVGTSSAYSVSGYALTDLQISRNVDAGIGVFAWKADNPAFTPSIAFARSYNNTEGNQTALPDGAWLGVIRFNGSDGSEFRLGADIKAQADGQAWATNDCPTRLVFSTTADGASSPTERFRIMQNGMSSFYNTGFVIPAVDNAVNLGGGLNRWAAVYAVNGTIQTSDARAKTEVTDSFLGSDFVKALRPVSYKWIEGGERHTGEYDEDGNFVYETVPGQRTHWGFIAQEVKEAVDAAGVDFGGWVLTDKDDPDSQQALRYDQFIAPLTKALQEAIARIETLEAEVQALKGGN